MTFGKRIYSTSVPFLEKLLKIFYLSLILREDTVFLLYNFYYIIISNQ